MTTINEFGFLIPDSQDEFGMLYFSGLSEKGNHAFVVTAFVVDPTYIKNSSSTKNLRLQSNSIRFTG